MKKKLVYFFILAMCVGTLFGCKKEDTEEVNNDVQQEVEQEVENEVVEEVVEEVEEEIPATQNLLTGLCDLSEKAIGKRPVAVMVNNVNDALPQYGIAGADIIFETQVEGDLTRLMAIYADYTKVPKICAIRSCRYYFPVMAHGFDAFYVNWGFDESIRAYVDSLGVTYFDGMVNPGSMFGRDKDRINSGYALEHTAYFNGTKFAAYVDSKGYRTDLLESKQGTAFKFNRLEEQVKPQGEDCTSVQVEFGAATATFSYDEATNTYLKKINGKNQMDAVAKTQLAFTNVFILETDISINPDGVHKVIDWDGGSNSVGYYVSNGTVQKITWEKTSETEYLKFYDESGEELSINRGKSYIALNYKNQATFK